MEGRDRIGRLIDYTKAKKCIHDFGIIKLRYVVIIIQVTQDTYFHWGTANLAYKRMITTNS